MELPIEIINSIKRYQEMKQKLERLRSNIWQAIGDEYVNQTGFTLGVGTFEPFIAKKPSENATYEEGTGTYMDEKPVGHTRSSKYYYKGKEYIAVTGSDMLVGIEYER